MEHDKDMKVKLTSWENEPVLSEIKKDILAAKNADDNESKVDVWLDHLHLKGVAKVAENVGRSSIAPKLIRKHAEWRYASLSEAFLSTEDLFEVKGISYEDVERAEQNKLLLNNQINTKIDKIRFIDDFVRALVNEGTGIVRVGWDFKEETIEEEVDVFDYLPASTEQEAKVIEDVSQIAELEDPIVYETQVPDELKEALRLSLQAGTYIVPKKAGAETREVTKVVKNHPTLEVCNYRAVTLYPSTVSSVDDLILIAYTYKASISELKSQGYKNLDDIQISIKADSDIATTSPSTEEDNNKITFKDEAREELDVTEYWTSYDIHNTGDLVPIVVTFVGNVVIRMIENPFPDKKFPFVVVPYLPVKGKIYGEPDAELLIENQKIIGAVTRGMVDILGRGANGQIGIRKDMLDVTNKRKFDRGEDYEFNPTVDPKQGYHMHTYDNIPRSAEVMLAMQNNEADAMSGVKAFSGGLSGDSLGSVATSVRGVLDAASKRELGILRRLASGVIGVGRKFISMNSEFLEDEEVVRITNKEFVNIKRDDLSGSFDISLTISTAEVDNDNANKLAFMLQTIGPNQDPALTRMIQAKIAKLHKMPDLAKQIESFEPTPDPVAQKKQELEIAKLDAEIVKLKSMAYENQANAELDFAKAEVEKAKVGNIVADTDRKALDFVEQETGTKQERHLEMIDRQVKGNLALKMAEGANKQILEKEKRSTPVNNPTISQQEDTRNE